MVCEPVQVVTVNQNKRRLHRLIVDTPIATDAIYEIYPGVGDYATNRYEHVRVRSDSYGERTP